MRAQISRRNRQIRVFPTPFQPRDPLWDPGHSVTHSSYYAQLAWGPLLAGDFGVRNHFRIGDPAVGKPPIIFMTFSFTKLDDNHVHVVFLFLSLFFPSRHPHFLRLLDGVGGAGGAGLPPVRHRAGRPAGEGGHRPLVQAGTGGANLHVSRRHFVYSMSHKRTWLVKIQ